MRSRLAGLAGVLALALIAGPATPFGGEDILWGRPWHHFDITFRALAGDAEWNRLLDQSSGLPTTEHPTGYLGSAGFTSDAAMGVAWHADYIDSYLYSPFWWGSATGHDVVGARTDLGRALSTPAYRASFLGFEDLARLHFDDVFTPAGLDAAWRRYSAGALAGLHWAAENDDLDAAQHLLGITLHAVQDFYSHSNWVDRYPDQTWHMVSASDRSREALYSGSYEISSPTPPHGTLSPDCTKLTAPGIQTVMATVCKPLSPLTDSADCEAFRRCERHDTLPVQAWGRRTPPDYVPDYFARPAVSIGSGGIAYDNTLMTRLHRSNRSALRPSLANGVADPAVCGRIVNFGIECTHGPEGDVCKRVPAALPRPCVTTLETSGDAFEQAQAEAVFASTKDQAIASSIQWVAFIDEAMRSGSPEVRAFWERVKRHRSTWSDRRAQYEEAAKLPYHFLSAGPYPTDNPDQRRRTYSGYGSGVTPVTQPGEAAAADTADGWYIRLEIGTSGDEDADTNADVLAEFAGGDFARTYLLDHLPATDATGATTDLLWIHDDFSRGRTASYTAGPFSSRPHSVTITNDASTRPEVTRAAYRDIGRSVDETLTDLRRSAGGLFAGRRDYVGDKDALYWASSLDAELERAGAQGVERTLEVGNEAGGAGLYRFTYRIRRLPPVIPDMRRFEVELVRVLCVKQSRRDQLFTPSDEPFFHTVITPFGAPGARSSYLHSEPFRNIRSGDSLDLAPLDSGALRRVVDVPVWSFFAIGAVVYEHDFDNAHDREQLWFDFTTGFDETIRHGNARFVDELGRLAGAAWKPSFIKAYAFRRGDAPEAGSVLTQQWGDWMAAEQSRRFDLTYGQVRPLLAPGAEISGWRTDQSQSLKALSLAGARSPTSGAAP